ncbi:MAG: fatty acid desaturase [Moraxellaceae bacterium]|nr:fatty acid desaturase [Moraxellaceae bacterium]
MRAIYRYREDIAPSLVVLTIFAIQLATFFFVESLVVVAGIMLALLSCSALPGSISHNHHHVPTFTRPWMNRVYEVILFLEVGIPPYAWTLHHNLGHHKDYLDQEKDPANWRMADGRVMSRIRYDIVGVLRIYPEIWRIGRAHPMLFRRFKIWTSVALAVLGVFLLLDPAKALLLFVAPMPVMYLGLLDNTYMQHSDLDTGSHLSASRNTTSRLYNLISWNLGYHTAHHIKPYLHWSRLPEFDATLAPRMPEGVRCDSVLLSACTWRQSRDGNVPTAQVIRMPTAAAAASAPAVAKSARGLS